MREATYQKGPNAAEATTTTQAEYATEAKEATKATGHTRRHRGARGHMIPNGCGFGNEQFEMP